VAPRTTFFGIVAPGGWEQFFADAGEVWGMTALPPADHPFDFSRMGPAMGKHRIMRVDNPSYAAATPIGANDQALPGGHASYFLEAGFGPRHVLFGHLSTALLTGAESSDFIDMRTIEGGRGATVPTLSHARTHVFLYVLDGLVTITIDGVAHHLTSGDCANIPAGTPYSTRVESGAARWVMTSSGGNGAAIWGAGADAATFSQPVETDADGDRARLLALSGVDLVLA
jgi:mannose-6-phosphate isomerase-like protein (cupin superfamily)